MKEEMVIQTSELDSHIKILARQLKDDEDKLRLHLAGSPSPFVVETAARTSSPTLTPNLTPTPLSTRIVDVHADPSPSTIVADVVSTLHVSSITTNDAVEYIDAADANKYIIHHQNLHTYSCILSLTEGYESAN